MLEYVRSLRCEIGILLHENLFSILHYIYLDLVRCGTRDHLKSLGFGVSTELSKFSAEVRLCLGMHCKILFYNVTIFSFLGSLLYHSPNVHIEFLRSSGLTAVRNFDVEPFVYYNDNDLAHRHGPTCSHVKLVSFPMKYISLINFILSLISMSKQLTVLVQCTIDA